MHSSYSVMTVFSATIQVQLLCSLGSHCSLCCCACPHHYRYMCWSGQSCHGKRKMLQPWLTVLRLLSCAISTRCAAAMCKVPSIHPQDGREQKRLAPLPLSRSGCLAAAVAVAKWAVEGGHGSLSSTNFLFKPAASFQLIIIAKVLAFLGFWLWAVFLFRNRLLLFVVSSAESLLMAG